MTLSRRIKLRFILMTAGLSILVGALLWGLRTLHRDVNVAFDEYREVRLVERAMFRVAHAHIVLKSDKAEIAATTEELASAAGLLQKFLGFQDAQRLVEPAHEAREHDNTLAALDLVRSVSADLNTTSSLNDTIFARLELAVTHLKNTSDMIDHSMVQMQRTATDTMAFTIAAAVISSVSIAMLAVAMSLWQYRSIIGPLRRLRDGARRFGEGHLDEHLAIEGDDEFAEVGDEFNRMARELSTLHRDLEEKVRIKSKELVRSERLASVGYLAAGVAHEINNPLNIISGYAELSLKELRKVEGSPPLNEVGSGLRIICEESFRCKDITEKLLSLSSSGESPRERVSLGHVAADIATMLQSLKQYRGRKVTVRCNGNRQLEVMGNETELKQVILNLTINALDSVEQGNGIIIIEGIHRNGRVEVSVTDNGVGIAADALEQVFEPFFTTRRRNHKSGTGLGLAITHAIVESHGGTISAASDGPGKGSRFVLRLPACPR